MPFMSQDYLESISDEKREQLQKTHMLLGYQPETDDDLLLPDGDRYAGTYVLGVTGVGKSALLENMIAYDVEAGNAVIVIDPHGDLMTNCLAQLPAHRVAKTYLLDMEDELYPFGVNAFSVGKLDTEQAKSQAVGRIMHIFEVLWADVLSQQSLPRYVRAAAITLLANPGSTLVDMHSFLLDDNMRRQMLQQVSDPTVNQFWKTQFDDLSASERMRRTQPLIGRLESLFMGRSLVRNIVGQRKNSISFRKAIENREIVFIRLPIKTMGSDARLVGTLLMAQIHAAVFSFANLPASQRPGVSLYADEVANFSTPDFNDFFTESRKYGLKLTVAHQYRSQLPSYLQDSTMSAWTKVCFRVKPDDGREMSALFPQQDEGVKPEDIEAHPVNHLLTYGSDDPFAKQFIKTYLRPMQAHKHGGKVDINGVHLTFDLWSGTKMREVCVPDPTPYLDNLLYQAMRTGNASLPIQWEAVAGFANCGRGFYNQAKFIHDSLLSANWDMSDFPETLVILSGDTYHWVRVPENGKEQLLHFLFHLRMVMARLANDPIGKKSAPSSTAVAQMLTQLPRRAAFVRSGDTVGVIYTDDTPERLTGRELVTRVKTILVQTRQKYCHPRSEVERSLMQPNVPAIQSNVTPVSNGQRVTVPPSHPVAVVPISRWEEV